MDHSIDRFGRRVHVGAKVRLVELGAWIDRLDADERAAVQAMIGDVFEVESIDDYGSPLVSRFGPMDDEGVFVGNGIALWSNEYEIVDP